MAEAHIIVDVRGMPELIWACRHEMSELLRAEADAEISPSVVRRLHEIAAIFEAGQRES